VPVELSLGFCPTLPIVSRFVLLGRRAAAAAGGLGPSGRSRAPRADPQRVKVTFDDVAGIDGAKAERREIADFPRSLSSATVPRATTTLNAIQRVGSSIGAAMVAVVLESQMKTGLRGMPGVADGSLAALPAGVRTQAATAMAHAFDHTFRWAVGFTVIAGLAALVLATRAPARAATPDRGRSMSRTPSSPRVDRRGVPSRPTTATPTAGAMDPTG
jgi:hypothetical protein